VVGETSSEVFLVYCENRDDTAEHRRVTERIAGGLFLSLYAYRGS